MTEHSPTPWKIEGFGSKSILDANDRYVSNIDNVDFIVTAVNAYDANQALIRQLVEALTNELRYVDDGPCENTFEALEAAREAGF